MRARSPILPRQVLIDTSAHYALVDRTDGHHAPARVILQQLAAERARLFTTNFILAETHALLLSRLGRTVALRALYEIDRSAMQVVRVTEVDEQRAWEVLTQFGDKDFSLTDATSFAVMERLGIAYACTFDHHFAQFGLTVLRPE